MRILAFALTITIAAAQAAAQTPTGTIQGTLKRAGDKTGIANAQIELALTGEVPAAQTQFFSAIPPGAQLTPLLLNALNAAIAMAPRPEIVRAAPSVSLPPVRLFSATTDSDGRFAFRDVPPGKYAITARRDGYFNLSLPGFAGTAVVITSPIDVVGEQTQEVRLEMERGGAIGGRVLDHRGNPAPNISIGAFQRQYQPDGRILFTPVTSKATDDRGGYRLFSLPPGEYWIAATPPRPDVAAGPGGSMTKTFFPDVVDPRIASPVIVTEGGDTPEVNILLQTIRGVTVSGRVVNAVTGTKAQSPPTFHLVPRDPDLLSDSASAVFPNLALGPDRADGRFEIREVPPGSYNLRTTMSTSVDGRGQAASGHTRLDVGSADMTDVTLNIRPGVRVAARLVYTGGDVPASGAPITLQMRDTSSFYNPPRANPIYSGAAVAPSVTVRAEPLTGTNVLDLIRVLASTPSVFSANFDSTGSLAFSNVPESSYLFQVIGLQANAYVADIRENGMSVFDRGLSVGATAPGTIEVIVNFSGEPVRGTVLGKDQKPQPYAQVVLAPPPARQQNKALYATAFSDASGRFTLQNVAPGEYRIFAWEIAPPANAHLNAPFISAFETYGRAVTIRQDARDIEVQAIPAESR